MNDADFATQFIGRVMRVAPELQRAFPQANAVPPDLDTAFVFLADARAQSGFADAAKAIAGVQSDLGGQIEQLVARRTAFGGVVLTNRPTAQTPLTYDMRLLPTRDLDGTVRAPELLQSPETDAVAPAGLAKTAGPSFEDLPSGASFDMFDMLGEAADGDEEGFDSLVADDGTPTLPKPRKSLRAPANGEELFAALEEAQLRSFKRRSAMAAHSLPARLVTEAHPLFDVLSLDVCEAAKQLVINDHTQNNAVKAALNRMTEKEISTELFTGEVTEDDVQVVTDQHALLERTHDTLATLGLEEQDCIEVIHTLSMRLMGAVEQAWALQDDAASPDPATMRSQARQAACWVIHKQFADLQEVLHSQWATRAKEELAHPLPDALLLPAGVAVQVSRKNMYGLHYPRQGATASARDALAPASRALLENKTYLFGETGEVLSLACIDGSYEFNASEAAFANALDLADFVVWWHRNPDRKPYSVGLVRADSKNLFYPDFIVCMTHMPGDAPLMRLVDPKFDTKDASRKAKHQSSYYGKVLFLTEDAKQFKIVKDDGSLGEVVDFDDLASLKSWMRNSQPAPQSK